MNSPSVAAPGVRNAVVEVAVVSGVAELVVDVGVIAEVVSCVAGPAVYFVAVVVVEPEVFFDLDLSVSEPEGVPEGAFVAFVVPVSVADASEHQAFVDIVLVFDI